MLLLFKSSVLAIRKRLVAFISLVILVILSVALFVGVNQSNDNLKTSYNQLILQGNAHHFSYLDFNSLALTATAKTDPELPAVCKTSSTADCFKALLGTDNPSDSGWIAHKAKVKYAITERRTYNQSFDGAVYGFENKKYIYKYVTGAKGEDPFASSATDRIIVTKGRKPTNDNEVVIYEQFAKLNNLALGDSLKNTNLKIVGFGVAPDFVLPIMNETDMMPDFASQTLAFVTPEQYDKLVPGTSGISDPNTENYWIGRFYSADHHLLTWDETAQDDYLALEKVFNKYIISTNPLAGVQSYDSNLRSGGVHLQMMGNVLLSSVFLGLILVVAIIILFFLVKKEVDARRIQFGILKAMGYRSIELTASLLGTVLLSGLVGSLIGYVIGIPIQNWMSGIYHDYFQLLFQNATFDYRYFIGVIFVSVAALLLVTVISGVIMLQKKALRLIMPKVATFGFANRKFVSLFHKTPFKIRLTFSFAFRSLSRISVIFIASFCMSILLMFIFLCSSMVNLAVEQTYKPINYQYNYNYSDRLLPKTATNQYAYNYRFERKEYYHDDYNPGTGHASNLPVFDLEKDRPEMIHDVINNEWKNANLWRAWLSNDNLKLLHQDLKYAINPDTKEKAVTSLCKALSGGDYKTCEPEIKVQVQGYIKILKFLEPQLKQMADGGVALYFGSVPYDENNELPYLFIQGNVVNDKRFDPNDLSDRFRTWYLQGLENGFEKYLTLTDHDGSDLTPIITNYNNKNPQPIDKDHPVPIILNEITALSKKIHKGDTFQLQLKFSGITSINTWVKVKGIVDSYQLTYFYMPYQGLYQSIKSILKTESNEKLYNAKFSNQPTAASLQQQTVYNLLGPDAANYNLTAFFSAFETNDLTIAFTNYMDVKASKAIMGEYNDIAMVVIAVFLIISAIIIVAILVIITNIIINENGNMISTFRILGYRVHEISSILLIIYIPVLIIAFAIGIPVGFAIVNLLISIVAQSVGVAFPIQLLWWYPIVGIVMIVALYLIAYIIQIWKLHFKRGAELVNDAN